jgi:ATP-dependent Lhr-like helicase
MVLSRVSPLAVPVLLEIGRERVAAGMTEEQLLHEAEELVAEAMSLNEPEKSRRKSKAKSGAAAQIVLSGIL